MTTARDRWIVCDDYAAGPFTAATAERRMTARGWADSCALAHRVVISARRPVTFAEIAAEQADADAHLSDAHGPILSAGDLSAAEAEHAAGCGPVAAR